MGMEGKIFPYFCHNFYDMTNNVMSIGQTNVITCQRLLGFFLQCADKQRNCIRNCSVIKFICMYVYSAAVQTNPIEIS